jgi:hypothetical protein
LLPLIKENSEVEGLTIMEYFTAILTGHVQQSQLFLVPLEEDEKPSARPRTKMTLRDRPQTATTAYAAENKSDDKTKEEEEDSIESDDDLEKTPVTRQKSNRVQTPQSRTGTPTRSVVVAKIFEMQDNLKIHMDKVQLQMESFKQAANADTINKRDVKTAMQNVWNAWSDMKYDLSKYLPRESF